MPPIVDQQTRPSTLIDLITQVKQAFSLMGDATPILVGKAYKDQRGAGSPPRVVFVPDSGAGKIEGPYEMGNAARMTHTCEVSVRAKESGDDFDRFKAAYALFDLVIDCLVTGAPGRIEWTGFTDTSPANNDAGYGVELTATFGYKRDVWHSAKRWALPSAGSDTSAPVAHPPPGTQPAGVIIIPTVTPIDSDGSGPGP